MSLVITLLLPLALAAICLLREPGRLRPLLPLASLPALALALLPESRVELEWILLGVGLNADATARPFLFVLGTAWSLCAWFALGYIREHARSFWVFWLLTLAGINLAFLAADMATFYSGYALMSLAGYGLVLHERTPDARRAGRAYIVLALAGEVSILIGLFLLTARFGNLELIALTDPALEVPGWPLLWLFFGFAVKMGTLPLHVWLPMAHPVAPAPASAILSGVIVKAGLLGWLRFLPPDAVGPGAPVLLLMALGLAGAFYAALYGLTQTRPKAILAWSTVSQMGVVLCIFAASMLGTVERDLLLPVLGLWVLHHGLNKGALFLATACAPTTSRWRTVLLVLPALSLAGLPLTSGAMAKSAAKYGFEHAGLPNGFGTALSLSSITTGLLLWHLYRRIRATDGTAAAHPAWILLTAAAVVLPVAWAVVDGTAHIPTAASIFDGLWPLAVAGGILVLWNQSGRNALRLPDDEMLGAWRRWRSRFPHRETRARTRPALRPQRPLPAADRWLHGLDRAWSTMPVAGACFLALSIATWFALTGA